MRLGCHKSRCSSRNCLRTFNFYNLCQLNYFSEAVSTNYDVLHFADDTAVLCYANIEANLQLIAENTLNKSDQYMKQNKLTWNKEKRS